ncbi:metabotropic glutamate receptor 4-like [Acanthaster planci]|uniref:Metabotropic glutamate receptor 4-like n=1 Tax=Acanthaster planci TaxID=133434 RepID=A0A8B7Y2N2_ACAPL|nr:metabotropic glutamate receptor 4-like [Acanthaster planci]
MCRANLSDEFLVWEETMIFAIQQVNGRLDILPDFKLGFYIRDDCDSEDIALWSALKIAQGSPAVTRNETDTGQVIGIVGPANSALSIYVAKVGFLSQLPVISVYGTSSELGNSDRFPFFLRAVPPDHYQVEAILDILLAFDWVYTALISSMDSYGVNGGTELLARAYERGVCFGFSQRLQVRPSRAELEALLGKIRALKDLSVIVMFAHSDLVLEVLSAVSDSNLDRHIVWIGTDAWPRGYLTGNPVLAPVAAGSILVRLYKADVPGLHCYMVSKDSRFTAVSLWMQEWFDSHPGCTSLSQCPVKGEGHDVAVVHSVYAFAYALDAYVNAECRGSRDCPVDGRVLMDYLHNVSFDVGHGQFAFDGDGEPTGRYLLKQIQFRDGKYAQVDIGDWDTTIPERQNRLRLNYSRLQWESGWDGPPSSVCVERCSPGSVPVPLPSRCCTGCTPCLSEQIVNGTDCLTCPDRQTPSENRSVCEDIIPRGVSWTHPIVLITVLFASLGVILVAVTSAGLFYYRDHALIKASSRELTAVNILGVTLTFSTIFSLYAYPTVASCAVTEVMLSCSIAILFATSFLKANRIYRVFKAGRKTLKKPRLISPKYQLALALSLIGIQVSRTKQLGVTKQDNSTSCNNLIISAMAALVNPPEPQVHSWYPWEQFCPLSYNFLVSGCYNLVLIMLCCYFAFKARKVPDNYNESKFIAISVYSMVLVCLVAVPVYVTAYEMLLKVATWSFAFISNGYLTLVFMYLPKLCRCRFGKPNGSETNESRGTRQDSEAFGRGDKLFIRTCKVSSTIQNQSTT